MSQVASTITLQSLQGYASSHTSVDGERRVVPKGGHGLLRPLTSTNVLPAPLSLSRRPSTSTVIRCCSPVRVSERVSSGDHSIPKGVGCVRREVDFISLGGGLGASAVAIHA